MYISPHSYNYTTLKPCEITENTGVFLHTTCKCLVGSWDLSVIWLLGKWENGFLSITSGLWGLWVYWLVSRVGEWKPALGPRRLLGSKATVNNNPSREGHFSSLELYQNYMTGPVWKASRPKKKKKACVGWWMNNYRNTGQCRTKLMWRAGEFLLPSASCNTFQPAVTMRRTSRYKEVDGWIFWTCLQQSTLDPRTNQYLDYLGVLKRTKIK